MREIEAVDERLADVGVNMPRQARQPGLDRVDAFADRGEAERMDDALGGAQLFFGARAVAVRHGDRRREIAEGDMIAAERLQRGIGVDDLVVGVAVEQLRRLVVHDFAQQGGQRLALVEPLAP